MSDIDLIKEIEDWMNNATPLKAATMYMKMDEFIFRLVEALKSHQELKCPNPN